MRVLVFAALLACNSNPSPLAGFTPAPDSVHTDYCRGHNAFGPVKGELGTRTGSTVEPAHTFSIVARDPVTGDIGVAVQSHYFSVGSAVTWAEPGVGAVATQSYVEPAYGPKGLALMRDGMSAPDAMAKLIAEDKA